MEEYIFYLDPPTVTSQQKRWVNGHCYEGERLAAARQAYMSVFQRQRPKIPLVGATKLEIEFYFTSKGKKSGWKCTKPDLDNECKLIQDCLVKSGYMAGDQQVCDLHLKKFWSDTGHIIVRMETL